MFSLYLRIKYAKYQRLYYEQHYRGPRCIYGGRDYMLLYSEFKEREAERLRLKLCDIGSSIRKTLRLFH